MRIQVPVALLLLAGCGGGAAVNIAKGRLVQTLDVHTNAAAFSIDFSPDGALLASSGQDGKVKIVDWARRAVVQELDGYTETAYPVRFDPSGERLFVGGREPKVYSVRDWSEVGKLPGHSWVYDFVFLGDRLVATAGGDDRKVQVWDAKTLERRQVLRPHERKIFSAAFDPRGGWLITAGQDGKAKELRIAEGWKEGRSFEEHSSSVLCVRASPRESAVVTTSANGEALLLQVGGLEVRERLRKHRGAAACAAFSRDGRWLATGGEDNRIYLYDRGSGGSRPVRVYENRGGRVNDIAFHPDGRWIVAAGQAGTVRIWHAEGR